MKKILLVCALLSISIVSTFAQTDFRKGSWGDSRAEIEKREGLSNAINEPDTYGFESSIGGKECIAAYVFTSDKLFRGAYIFTSIYFDGKEYIRDFNYLKELLTMKYEEPDEDELIWASKSWKDEPDHYGLALLMGDVSYSTQWSTDTTSIHLSMAKESGKVVIMIFYDSIDLSADHQAKILEDL